MGSHFRLILNHIKSYLGILDHLEHKEDERKKKRELGGLGERRENSSSPSLGKFLESRSSLK